MFLLLIILVAVCLYTISAGAVFHYVFGAPPKYYGGVVCECTWHGGWDGPFRIRCRACITHEDAMAMSVFWPIVVLAHVVWWVARVISKFFKTLFNLGAWKCRKRLST